MNIQTRPDAGVGAEKLLTQAEAPIRSNFLPDDRMRQLGELLARGGLDTYFGLTGFDFQARVRDDGVKILEVYRAINAAQAKGDSITPAAQWLLDNHYLVEETIFQVKRDLPRKFYRELPTMEIEGGVRVPRVLAIAWVYVAHCDSTVSSQSLKAIVDGFQSIQPLLIGELWALPSLLRFVLAENLRRIAVRVRRAHQMRQLANDLADRVLAASDGESRTAMLAGFASHAQDMTFATQLLYRLRDGSQNAGKALIWLEGELEKRGSDSEEIIVGEHRNLSTGNVTMGNIVRGLRLVNDIDWTMWFETVSRIDEVLREKTDFASLDFYSRDQYRTAIEELARRSEKSEFEVTLKAIGLAADAASPEGWRAGHPLGCRLLSRRKPPAGTGSRDRLCPEYRQAHRPPAAAHGLDRHPAAGACTDHAAARNDDCRAGGLRRFNRRNRHSDHAVRCSGGRGRAQLLQHGGPATAQADAADRL